MFRAKTVPKWLLSRNIGKRIVMNQHNGLATQGLIERGKGAIAFWKVDGYSPREPRIMIFVRLSDAEAQKIFDADPSDNWFLEPVWGTIKDPRVAVDVLDTDGRRSLTSVELPRGLNVDEFLDQVEATVELALTNQKKKQPPKTENIKLLTPSGFGKFLELEIRPEDVNLRIGKSPAAKDFKAKGILSAKKSLQKTHKRRSGVGVSPDDR